MTSLIIATPCMSGKFDANHVESLIGILNVCRHEEIETGWIVERFNADVAAARDSLVHQFLTTTDYDYLLMIDDDVAIAPRDVIRMINTRMDFVALAGPKKSYPIRYAVNKVDDKGTPIPMEFRPDTGTFIADEVGFMAALMTREMLQMMTQAYPSLRYGGGITGLFMPEIVGANRTRRLAEDYAFCYRWRRMGGEVHILPDAHVQHTGLHTFNGQFGMAQKVAAE